MDEKRNDIFDISKPLPFDEKDSFCSLGIKWNSDMSLGITQDGGFKFRPKEDDIDDTGDRPRD